MKTISSVIAIFLLIPLSSNAQQPQQNPPLPPLPSQQTGPVLILQMDKDGDKKISRSEFLKASEERAQKQFQHLDINGDGYITIDEENKARDQAIDMIRKQMETNRMQNAPQQK